MKKLLAVMLTLMFLLQPFGNIVLAEEETAGAENTQVETQPSKAPDVENAKQNDDQANAGATAIESMSSSAEQEADKSNVKIAAAEYTLTIATASGSVSERYEAGTRVDISAYPLEAKSVFAYWAADPKPDNIVANTLSANTYVTMPAYNVVVKANYSPDDNATYNVTKNTTSNGSFTVSPASGKVSTLVTIDLTPDEGYRLAADGGLKVTSARYGNVVTTKVSETRYTFYLPTDDVSVTVKYELIKGHKWDVAKGTQTKGTISKVEINGVQVTSFPGKAEAGDEVKVTAAPNQYYKVQSLTIKEEQTTVYPDANNICKFTMPAKPVTLDLTCIEGDDYPWTISKAATTNGIIEKILVNGKEITTFPGTATAGSTITVQTKPTDLYDTNTVTVTGVTPNITASGTGNTRTFTMPKANVTVNATFTSDYKNLTIATTNYGSITQVEVNGVVKTERPVKAKSGDTIRITSVADYTYLPNGLTISGASPSIAPSLVSSDKTTRTYVYEFKMQARDLTATPAYTRDTTKNFAITKVINPAEGGSYTVTTAAYAGTTVTISSIAANTGFVVGTVTVKGTSSPYTSVTVSGSGTSRTFTMPEFPVTVTVNYTKNTAQTFTISRSTVSYGNFTFQVNDGPSGLTSASGVKEGDTIKVTATPTTRGYKSNTVTVSSGTPAVTPTKISEDAAGNTWVAVWTFTMPFRNVTVGGTFASTTDYQWNIIKGAMTNGTISKIEVSSNGASGPFVEKTTAKYNDVVRITTAPNSKYRTLDLTATSSTSKTRQSLDSVTGVAVYTFTKSSGADSTVTATFEYGAEWEYDITKATTVNGTISKIAVNGVAISTFPGKAKSGDTITVTTAPSSSPVRYATQSVSVSGTPAVTVSGTGNTRTFTMPSRNVEVGATFIKDEAYKYDIETVGIYGQVDTKVGGVSVKSGYVGETVNIIPTPDMGYKDYTIEVKGRDNGTTVSVSGNAFTMPGYPVRVTVTFKHDDGYKYPTPDNPGTGGGTGGPTGGGSGTGPGGIWWEIPAGDYKPGDTVNIYTYPARGWRVKTPYSSAGVLVNKIQGGAKVSVTEKITDKHYTFIFPEGGVKVYVYFELDPNFEWDIRNQATVNGSFKTTKGGVTVSKSKATETVTIEITPNTWYDVSQVLVIGSDGKEVTVSGTGTTRTFTMPWMDVDVYVSFTNNKDYEYNIAKAAAVNGTISKIEVSNNGTGGPFVEQATAKSGATVRITTTPSSGYTTDVVSVSGTPTVTVSGSVNTRTFTMPPRDVTVTSTFKVNTNSYFNINTKVTEGSGTIKILKGSEEVTKANAEDVITVTGIPDEQYIVKSIKVAGTEVAVKDGSATFTMPNKNITVQVAFGRDTAWEYNITCLPTKNGEFSTSVTKAKQDEYVYIYDIPSDGFEVESVIVDGGNVDVYYARGNHYFVMPDRDVTVEVKFRDTTDYHIEYQYSGGGYVYGEPYAREGNKINVYLNNGGYYEILDVSVVAENGGQDIPITRVGDHNYYESLYEFTMPRSNVVVYVTFIPPNDESEYNIYKGEEEHGKFDISHTTAMTGETVTITTSPDSDYKVDSVSVTNNNYGHIRVREDSDGVYSFFMPAEDVTVNVKFRSVYNDIILGDQVNGRYSANKYLAKEGEKITLTATPNLGYKVGGVFLDTYYDQIIPVETAKNVYKFDMPDMYVNAYIWFIPDPDQPFNLTVVDGTGSGSYKVETFVPVSATVPKGCTFVEWKVIEGDSRITNSKVPSTLVEMVASNTVVKPIFKYPEDQTFILDVVGGTNSGLYLPNKVVDVSLIEATVPSGYMFSGWYTIGSGVTGLYDNLISDKNSKTIKFTMPSDNVRLICAYSVDMGKKFKITPVQAPNGSFNVSHKEAYVTELIKISALPDVGYKVGDVRVVMTDDESIKVNVNELSYTDYQFKMPGFDVTVYVTFEEDPDWYYISKGPEVNGTFSVDPTRAKKGEEKTVTIVATPDEGYRVKNGSVTAIGAVTLAGENITLTPQKISEDAVTGVSVYEVTVPASNVGNIRVNVEFEPAAPGKPLNLEAVAGETMVALLWNAPVEGDVEQYKIRWIPVGGTEWSEWIGVPGVNANNGKKQQIVRGLLNEQEYVFQVCALNENGVAGEWSAPAKATPMPPEEPGGREADLISIRGKGVMPGGGWPTNKGNSPYSPNEAIIELPSNVLEIYDTNLGVSQGATYTMYSAPTFTAGSITSMINRLDREGNWIPEVAVCVRVTSMNGEVTKYYWITVVPEGKGTSYLSTLGMNSIRSMSSLIDLSGQPGKGSKENPDETYFASGAIQLDKPNEYYTASMQPITSDSKKQIYKNANFTGIATGEDLRVAPGEEKTFYVLLQTNIWFADNFGKGEEDYVDNYYKVRVLGYKPDVILLLDTLAGVNITKPALESLNLTNGLGSQSNPIKDTIYVDPDTKTSISRYGDINITQDGDGNGLLCSDGSYSNYPISMPLDFGGNPIYLIVSASGGQVYYEITVYRGYKVTYDANGATSGNVPVDGNVYKKDTNNTVTVLGKNTLYKDDGQFLGWALIKGTQTPDYQPGGTFNITKDVTLYAVWSQSQQYNIEKIQPTNGTFNVPDKEYNGNTVQITNIAPSDGYEVEDIIVKGKTSGTAVSVNSNKEFIMPSEDVTVEVKFKEDSTKWATITFAAGAHGTLSTSTPVKVLKGTLFSTITVPTVTAVFGWEHTGWSPVLPAGTSAINANATYTAQYAEKDDDYATITFAAGAHGTLSTSTPIRVLKGTLFSTITIPTVTAELEWIHTGWSPVLPAGTSAINANETYTAQYELNPDNVYSITKAPANNGTFKTEKGGAEVDRAKANDTITVSADPAKGYRVKSVTVDGTPAVTVNGSGKVYTFTMPARNITVSVEFERDPAQLHKITKIPPVNGEFEVPKEAYNGDIVEITDINPEEGYRVKKITVKKKSNGEEIPVDRDNKFEMPDEEVTVEVEFEKDPAFWVTLTFLPGTDGKLSGADSTGKVEVEVLKGKAWTDVVAVPRVDVNRGWKHTGWSPVLPSTVPQTNATYTAQYEKDYREMWVTITFAAGANGTLSGQSSFKVLKGSKWSDVITVPGVVPGTGWKQKVGAAGWSAAIPAGSSIINENETYTAQYEQDNGANATITFAAGDHGTLSGTTEFSVVKGTLWSAAGITVPTVTPSEGWRHIGWSPVLPTSSAVNVSVIYTAQYEPDYTSDVWATIKFVAGDHGALTGTTEFKVIKGTQWSASNVAIPGVTPESGWKQKGGASAWSPSIPAGTDVISKDATYEAQYEIDDDSGLWATITFAPGSNGTLSGKSEFKVLKGSKWSDVITMPGVVPGTGWKQKVGAAGWSAAIPAGSSIINGNETYTAQYEQDNGANATITFAEGDHGTLSGTTEFIVAKGTLWSAAGITEPTVAPSAGWRHIGWSPVLPTSSAVNVSVIYTAQYEPDYTSNVWATIKFLPGAHGTLLRTTEFKVLKGTQWSDVITMPEVIHNLGWRHTGWTPSIPADATVINGDATYTAQYDDDISSLWATIKFEAGAHGTLSGTVEFEVLKETLWSKSGITVPKVNSGSGWKQKDGSMGWSAAIPAGTTLINADAVYTAQYERDPSQRHKINKLPPVNGDFEVQKEAYEGDQVEITDIKPDVGYKVKKIIVKKKSNGEEIPVDGYNKFIMPGEEVTVEVEFEPDPNQKFKIFKEVSINGTFDVSHDEASVETLITVTPKADAGYKVGYITVDKVLISGNTFKMPAHDVTVAVTFEVDPSQLFKIIKAPTTNGSFDVSKTEANVTDEIVVSTTPARGYKVDTVTVSGTPAVNVSGSNNEYKFTMPARDVVVTVTFVQDPDFLFNITTTQTGSGTVSTSKNQAKTGETITVSATPAPGYMLGTISVSGMGTLASGVNTFTMPGRDVTVNVVFVRDATQWATVTFRAGANGRLTGTTTFDVLKGSAWSTVTVPRTRANTGYSFSRWSPALPTRSTLITEDMSFTASFTYVGVPTTEEPIIPTPTVTAIPVQSVPTTEGPGSTEIPNTTPPTTEKPADNPNMPDWALVNLILCILGALIAIVLIIRALLLKNRKQDEDEEQYMSERERKYTQRRILWLVTAIIMGIAGVIVFLLTENMNNPMTMVDSWTILNAIILIVEIIGTALVFKRKDDRNDRNENSRSYQ